MKSSGQNQKKEKKNKKRHNPNHHSPEKLGENNHHQFNRGEQNLHLLKTRKGQKTQPGGGRHEASLPSRKQAL
jgi:hypothetical protein